jgi:hypothetical protein
VNQKPLEDPNYQLTHHEYASIAGVELRKTDSEPDLTLSRQISEYERWKKFKYLGQSKNLFNPPVLKKGFLCTAPITKRSEYIVAIQPDGTYVFAYVRYHWRSWARRVDLLARGKNESFLNDQGQIFFGHSQSSPRVTFALSSQEEVDLRTFLFRTTNGNYFHFLGHFTPPSDGPFAKISNKTYHPMDCRGYDGDFYSSLWLKNNNYAGRKSR